MKNGLGTAGLVLGILAIVFCWTVVGGIILGILGLVFGLVGRSRASRNEANNGGAALAGAITGGIGLLLAVIFIIAGIGIANRVSRNIDDYNNCLDRQQHTSQDLNCGQYLNR
jgi:heme/copper-type cytochrome/quinol oxidase subunit 2